MNARLASACLMLLTSGCPRPRGTAPADAGSPRVDAERVPAIAEVPPMGAAPDGSEVDVPLSWIYLLTDPAPTGSTPYAVVGARVPCGFVPRYTVSDRGEGEIRLRMRAQRRATDGGRCEGGVDVVEQVSLSLVRLGTWRVVDGVPHGAADAPVPAARTLHVVADDGSLRPAAERWTRACAATVDCEGGGECVRVGPTSICQPAMDPWLQLDRPCPGGTRATTVASEGGPPRRHCIAACDGAGQCPGNLRCDAPTGTCLPSPRVDAGTSGAGRGLPAQGSDASRR